MRERGIKMRLKDILFAFTMREVSNYNHRDKPEIFSQKKKKNQLKHLLTFCFSDKLYSLWRIIATNECMYVPKVYIPKGELEL